MHKKNISSEVSLALKSTLGIGLVMILLFIGFTFMMRNSLNRQKSKQLLSAVDIIYETLLETGPYSEDFNTEMYSVFLDLPYFIDYSVIDRTTTEVLFSNNTLLPVLPQTQGRTVHHVVRNYFTDGNLDILYLTKEFAQNVYIQVSVDIENDSASKMIYYMPMIIPLMIAPILILTFLVLLLIIRKDFSREHDFSANVSHELQTPVNAILGHAKLLERWGKNDAEQTEKSLKIIINEAKSMEATITNLLQITKLEKKMVRPHKDQIDIADFFEALKEEFAYRTELELEFQLDTPVMLVTDRELFHQIFVIVISNSLKFCPKPCKVKITCGQNKHGTVLELQDNGPGFSKEILPYIFDRFYRGDKAHSRTKGGAGLGLSIAKTIANALDIKITAGNGGNGGAVVRLEV